MIAIQSKAIIPIVHQKGALIGKQSIDLDRDPSAVLYFPGYPYTGLTINDRSGGSPANNGTITGATWVREASGLRVNNFDGDDFIGCGANASLNIGTNDFYIMGWVSFSTGAIIQKVKGINIANEPGFIFYARASNPYLRLLCWDGTNNVQTAACPTDYRDSTYHHIAADYIRATKTTNLYVDSVLIDTAVGANTLNTLTSTFNLEIGRNYEGGVPNSYLVGKEQLWRLVIGASLTQGLVSASYTNEKWLFQ